ncbi:hypothetical protein SacmaDRAFT_0806 [Saccharomonospora marina XMU15]|uniref:Lipocalin-like domain-containing protein n=1 Tax=Saccharomonospora marina XMU15 TaxID=882083 RepID=H5X871_9PSEU|nr:hypothetical protein [Saccharomonospora marina]EHR49102.1 hypothetical protein SacmaDRAFT_0806 [Saccharomonospora marina XMU15]
MSTTIRAAAAALCLLGVLSVAGCGQRIAGTPSAAESTAGTGEPSSAPVTAPSPTRQSRLPQTGEPVDLASLQGLWRGQYQCAQGETGMELEISAPEGDTVEAVFRFFALPGQPQGPSGSFSMRGRNTETGLVFVQQEWIEQPDGYVMVDLGVSSVEGDTMTGRVAGPGCGDFTVTRQ